MRRFFRNSSHSTPTPPARLMSVTLEALKRKIAVKRARAVSDLGGLKPLQEICFCFPPEVEGPLTKVCVVLSFIFVSGLPSSKLSNARTSKHCLLVAGLAKNTHGYQQMCGVGFWVPGIRI